MTGTEVLLDVRNLSAWYGAAQILFDVDLQVHRGEVVALMGRNGAGKSTTLKAVMGLLAKRKGALSFMGRDISHSVAHDLDPAERILCNPNHRSSPWTK